METLADLKLAIREKYKTESACAKAMKWPRQRLNKITNGTKEPDLQEVAEISNSIDAPVMDVANIFLPKRSPNG